MIGRLFVVVAFALSLTACSSRGGSSGPASVVPAGSATRTFREAARTLPVVYGGGAVLPFNVYTSEISTFNATATKATFTPYLPNVDSTIGLSGFLRDDFTCLQNDGSCSGDCPQPNCYPGPLPDDYAANDIPVSAQTISVWAISGVGQPFSGNFIQIPSMGYGVAIPVVNPAVSKNGGATLSDNDLCGIFSGKLTDFSQITDAGVTWSGPITVTYYASQGQGITFTLTDHLNTVCNSSNSNIMFTAQFSFASEFSSNHVPVPSNFVALSGSAGIADYLAGLSGTSVTSAVGYLTPDYTSLVPTSPVTLSNGLPSPLLVAAVFRGKTKELPYSTAIGAGLNKPATGVNLVPPSNAGEGANPSSWFPLIATTKAGYPIVGYTAFDFAQCYASPKVSDGILAFLKAHYGTGSPLTTQINNGFAPVAKSFAAAIKKNILADSNSWNDNIENTTACAELAGR